MYPPSALAFVSLLAAAASAQNSTAECAKGLKMFVSRGTNETLGSGSDLGLGATGKLVKDIARRIEDSDYEGIPYPASMWEPSYFHSVANGTRMVRERMTAYAKACPDSKMAWFGYSQGAQITTSSLCGMPVVWGQFAGYGEDEFDKLLELSVALPESLHKNIVSVVLFGDPTQRNDTSYNHGTWNNTGNGIFYRSDTSSCAALGRRIRAYCDAGDPFCDVGDYLSLTAHGRYIENYGDEIADFVVGQYNGDDGGDDGGDDDDGNGGDSTGSDGESSDDTPGTNGAGRLASVTGLSVLGSLLALALL